MEVMTLDARIAELQRTVAQALTSASVLFQRPSNGQVSVRAIVHRQKIDNFLRALQAVRDELTQAREEASTSRRYYEVVDESPDSIDYINTLVADGSGRPFSDFLTDATWDAVRERLPRGPVRRGMDLSHFTHTLAHAQRLLATGIGALTAYTVLLESSAQGAVSESIPRLDPTALGESQAERTLDSALDGALTPKKVKAISTRIKRHDRFAQSRTFRVMAGDILPGTIGEIRMLENFYGYTQERKILGKILTDFIDGVTNRPLLVTGMPGMGKTHMTIAHALSQDGLTLVNAEQEDLGAGLEELVITLGQHPYRKFLVFFDDVEPDHVPWSTFRNQVDGYLPYPDNVEIVIATNGEFPASIRSRCRVFELRPMNPEVCEEFIVDYLNEHRWMSQPYPNLVSTLAADFSSMFRRRVVNELTPRSLIQYFEMLEKDTEKIRRLIRESLEDVVRVPSEEPFIESNRQILHRLERERGIRRNSLEGRVEPNMPQASSEARLPDAE